MNYIKILYYKSVYIFVFLVLSGAGAVEMKFYTTVNVSAVKLFGTASR